MPVAPAHYDIQTGIPPGVQFASISHGAASSVTVVAAVAGQRILVLGYTLTAAAAQTVVWKSGSTAISGVMTMSDVAPVNSQNGPYGVLKTVAGEALVLTLSGAVQVSGHIAYVMMGS